MRCRVCGYEVGPEATHCPMCGSRVSVTKAAPDGEISWNTKDFPKPKEMEDIKMAWPEFSTHSHAEEAEGKAEEKAADNAAPVAVMSDDASEGYVSIPEKKEAAKEPEKKEPEKKAPEKKEEAAPAEPYWYTQKFTATGIMKTGPAWPSATGGNVPPYPAKATIESMTLEDILQDYVDDDARDAEPAIRRNTGERFPMLDTLAQKNAEFQKLLDMEYDRLHAMHGEEAVKELEDARFVPDQSVKAKDISTFEKMLMESASVPAEETPAQKFFSKPTEAEKAAADKELEAFIAPSGDPSKYDINQIENTIRELQEEEKRAEKRRTERQKRLETMALAREAYLKSLDEANAKKSKGAAKAAASVADASPLDWSNSEPTKEIPVGSILKALAAGGALAAVEKSVEDAVKAPAEAADKAEDAAAKAAEEAAEKAAEKAEEAAEELAKEAEEPVRAAAMAVQPIASIRQDPDQTKVFRRSLTEEAEERARLYEDAAEDAADAAEQAAEHKVERITEGAEDLAKRYEAAFGREELKAEDDKAAEAVEDIEKKVAAVFSDAEQKAADEAEDPQSKAVEDFKDIEEKAAEIFGTADDKADEVSDNAEDKAAEIFDNADNKAAELFDNAENKIADTFDDAAQKAADPEEIAGHAAAAIAAAVAEKEAGEAESRLAEAAAKIEQQLARGLDGADPKPEERQDADQAASQDADANKAAEDAQDAAARKAEDAAEDLAKKYEDAGDQAAEQKDAADQEAKEADQAAAQDADADKAAEDAQDGDVLDAAFAGKDAAEPTHEIDAQEIQKAQEEKKDDEEDEEVRKSKHIFLKIVAVILIICAIFEAAVWGLKQFAPGSAITENAIQIERGIGDALVSLYDTVANWIKGITGGN